MKTNGLTPAKAERLAKFVEEAGEGLQAAGKILIYGYHPTEFEGVKFDNKANLEKELGDILATISLLAGNNDVDVDKVLEARDRKLDVIQSRLNHQGF